MEVSGHIKIGRRKLRWSDLLQKDTKKTGVQTQEAHNQRIKTRANE